MRTTTCIWMATGFLLSACLCYGNEPTLPTTPTGTGQPANTPKTPETPSESKPKLAIGATEEQIRQLMGEPTGWGRNESDGVTTWMYNQGIVKFIKFKNGRAISFIIDGENKSAVQGYLNNSQERRIKDVQPQQAPGTYRNTMQGKIYAQRKAVADRVFLQRKAAADRLYTQRKSSAEWCYERELVRVKERYDTSYQHAIDYSNRSDRLDAPRQLSADLALLTREYEIATAAAKSRYEASLNEAERSWNTDIKEAEEEWNSFMTAP